MTEENFAKLSATSRPKVLAVHLELMQYPILSKKMRELMREQLFSRGIIDVSTFETEAREKAIVSQQRENMDDPFSQESEEVWLERLGRIRDILTEFYFALNFKHSEFLKIVREVLAHKRPAPNRIFPAFNPEIAPWKMLFSQARQLEALPEAKRKQFRHHLQEIIVVLTKGMLSDQLSFIGIARNIFSIKDIEWIYNRRIGRGKIGGKAGGMMLAKAILHNPEPDDPVDYREIVSIPESYFLGSDVIYEFVEENDFSEMVHQKYRPFEEIQADYPRIMRDFVRGNLPDQCRHELRKILEEVGNSPLIVRSSSLLEDNFGIAFAGKYDSYFCPNQGTVRENLEDLCTAIKKVYASIISPDALAYRQQKGLIDYDERMAILIQKVQGQTFGENFFPTIAGVAFSHNPFLWNPRIDRNAGFLRIVAGLGTRAVDRLASDYAKMVALSHPTLQPVKNVHEVIQYSQKNMDVINLADNQVESLPVNEILNWKFPNLQMIGSIEKEGDIHPILMAGPGTIKGNLIITFDGLMKNKQFITAMKGILSKLERHYNRPVDVEFTVDILSMSPFEFRINILQCRQQSKRAEEELYGIPPDITQDRLLLQSQRMVSTGRVCDIEYIVYIDPEMYNEISDSLIKWDLAKIVGKLNGALEGKTFILIGPGRWGSSNINLGVPVTYAEIFNARVLVEVAIAYGDVAPEASYGTHFFQDLVESNIYPLPIYPQEKGAAFNYHFFRNAPNKVKQFVSDMNEKCNGFISVIDVKEYTHGRTMEIIMNATEEKAVGFIK